MPADNIEPLEQAYKTMREATRPLAETPNENGPLVYELTNEGSTNGVDLTYKDLPGGGRVRGAKG